MKKKLLFAAAGERRALVDIARARLSQFAASRDVHVCALALLAEGALHDAISAGVSVDHLAAELDLSPHALSAILKRDPGLLVLHPSRTNV